MKNKCTLFFLLIIVSTSSYSQLPKTKAKLIFTDNDSLIAEIKEEQLYVIQTHIDFRSYDSVNFTRAYPGQIKSVSFIDGRLFETIKTDSVSYFLWCILEGYYNLYTRVEKNGKKTYYLKHAQDDAIHLTETFTEKTINGQLRKVSNYEYAHALIEAMDDDIKISPDIYASKFTEHDLLAIVKKYNEFKGTIYPESAKVNAKSTKISVGILVNSCPVFLSPIPGLGMTFDFYRNRPYEKFSIRTRFSLNLYPSRYDETNKLILAEIPVGLSYSYLNLEKFRFDVLGGISSFMIFDPSSKNEQYKTDFSYSALPYLGAGVDYKFSKSRLRLEFSVFDLNILIAYIF